MGPVVIKIDDPGSDNALYVGFNHKVLYNNQTEEGSNQVTTQEYAGSGYYSQSRLVAKLSSNGQLSSVLGAAKVTVSVSSIDTDPNTGSAQISIKYGNPQSVSSAPTSSPLKQPTMALQVRNQAQFPFLTLSLLSAISHIIYIHLLHSQFLAA